MVPSVSRLTLLFLCLTVGGLGLFAVPVSAQATDGAYKRWQHDFVLTMAAGGGVSKFDDGVFKGSVTADLRLRIIDAAGPFVAMQWAPQGQTLLMGGVELRPLWPALFLLDLSFGNEFFDLLVQSLGLDLGVAAIFSDATQSAQLGFVIGLSLEVPIVLPSMWNKGVFIRLAMHRTLAPAETIDRLSLSSWSIHGSLVLKFGIKARRRDAKRF